jgi:hypothetical protein
MGMVAVVMNPYYYLFYLLYRLSSGWGPGDRPELGATMFMGVVTYIMAVALAACLEPFTHIVIDLPQFSLLVGLTLVFVLALPHYVLIVRNGKSEKIIQRIESQSRKQRMLQLVMVLLITLTPPILFVILVSLNIVHRN